MRAKCLQLIEGLRRFSAAQGGNVALTFAIAIIPICCFAGAAIDYSDANWVKSKLDAAADAAAISAVAQASLALTTNEAETTAINLFNANASSVVRTKIKSIAVKVQDGKNGRTAVVKYTAKVSTAIMGLVGINKITLHGTSSAAAGIPPYADFYLLLDNSPSMGVGATTSDIDTMVANTSDQCAFACHDQSAAPNDYYNLAKKLGVQMRIDVMRLATQQLMDTATATQILPNQFRMAIYTFGTSAAKLSLTTIQSLTSNLSKAKSAASAIDLMSVPYQNYAGDTDTDIGGVLSSVNGEVSNPGDGTSSSPLKYVFFVSDGVSDRALGSPVCAQPTVSATDPQNGKTYTRCQEPVDPSICDAMKKRGVKIAVLYTTYLPLPTNAWYNSWIAPFNDQIATRMQSCASAGLYFEVSPTQGIADAMSALFKKAVQQARLVK